MSGADIQAEARLHSAADAAWRKMGAFTVVTGVEEVDFALRDFDDKAKKALLRAATRTIAKRIQRDAISLAPELTGAMKRAIRVASLGRTRRGNRRKVGASVTVGKKLFVGDEFYAGFLEYGTKERQQRDGHRTGRIGQGLFDCLRRALWGNRSYAVSSFADAVRQAIAAARLRASKKAAKLAREALR